MISWRLSRVKIEVSLKQGSSASCTAPVSTAGCMCSTAASLQAAGPKCPELQGLTYCRAGSLLGHHLDWHTHALLKQTNRQNNTTQHNTAAQAAVSCEVPTDRYTGTLRVNQETLRNSRESCASIYANPASFPVSLHMQQVSKWSPTHRFLCRLLDGLSTLLLVLACSHIINHLLLSNDREAAHTPQAALAPTHITPAHPHATCMSRLCIRATACYWLAAHAKLACLMHATQTLVSC